MTWLLGDEHPIYGEVVMMGVIDGEPIRWFKDKYGCITMIQLDVLNYE